MAIKPLVRNGNSSNITYYSERGARSEPYIWASVCRNDFHWPSGVLTRRKIPTFSFTVYRNAEGELGTFTYEPKSQPPPGALPEPTVTRLVREWLSKHYHDQEKR